MTDQHHPRGPWPAPPPSSSSISWSSSACSGYAASSGLAKPQDRRGPAHRRYRLGPRPLPGGRHRRRAAEAEVTGRLTVCAYSCGPGNPTSSTASTTRTARIQVLAIASQIPSTQIGTTLFSTGKQVPPPNSARPYRPRRRRAHAGGRRHGRGSPRRRRPDPRPGCLSHHPGRSQTRRCRRARRHRQRRQQGHALRSRGRQCHRERSSNWPTSPPRQRATRCVGRRSSTTRTSSTSACRACSATASVWARGQSRPPGPSRDQLPVRLHSARGRADR